MDPRTTAPIGWRVLDPAGNVLDSGPLIELESVAFGGEEAGDS